MWAAATPKVAAATATKAENSAEINKEKQALETQDSLYTPRTLDGVTVEAVETYPFPSASSLGLGLGIYPINGYYSALLLNLNYLNRMSRNYAWEVLNVNYSFTFDKDLAVELADRYHVNPQRIDRLQFMVSTNVLRTLAYGKFVFMDKHIRYFQLSGLLGLGFAKSTLRNDYLVDFGLRAEVFTSEKFSWRLDARDGLTIQGFNHFVTFMVSTGYAF